MDTGVKFIGIMSHEYWDNVLKLAGGDKIMLHNLKAILSELRGRLQSLYGDRLAKVILFGSQARGEATENSDIDVMVILKGDVSPSLEIARTIDDVADISLANDVVLSCVFMPESRYDKEQSPLILNVHREGLAV